MMFRVKSGAIVGQDFGFVKVENGDINVVFRLRSKSGDRYWLEAPGFGEKGNYGAGAILVREGDLIFHDPGYFLY